MSSRTVLGGRVGHRPRQTLALRLAVGNTLITSTAVALGAIATWSLAWWSALAGIDQRLIDLRQQMAHFTEQRMEPPPEHPPARILHPPDIPGGILLRFRSTNGTVVWHSTGFPDDLPVPGTDRSPHTVQVAGHDWRSLHLNDHAHLPMILPETDGPHNFVVDCAIDLTPIQEESWRLATLLGLLWLGSTALAAFSSVAVRKILIAPVANLTRQIGAIDANQLGRRLDREVPGELVPVVERINDLLARLEQAFAREKETINTIAHELRTPVTIQRGTLEFAVLDGGRPISPQVAQRCLGAAITMQRLIEDLLSLARLESGQEVLQAEAIDLLAVVQRAWEQNQTRAVARHLALDIGPWTTGASPDPLLVVGTPGLSQSVVAGLIGNSVDHAPAGDRLLITWSMTATQVAMTVVNHIATADPSPTTRPHLGIGLPLCERIMRVLGGSLVIVETDGRFQATATFSRSFARSRQADPLIEAGQGLGIGDPEHQ